MDSSPEENKESSKKSTKPPLPIRPTHNAAPPNGSYVAEMSYKSTESEETSSEKRHILQHLYSDFVSLILYGPKKTEGEDIKRAEAEAEAETQKKKEAAAAKAAAAADAVQETKNIILDNKLLSEKIKCVEYSIKKLELDMRLTNEDSIGTDEFNNVLHEIIKLSNNVSDTCIQRITITEFEESARMKRKMNSYAAMIKMASFICPVLAIANKSALTRLSEVATTTITDENIKNTKNICSTIIMSMLNFASIENGEILEVATTAVDVVDKGHDVGVIEAVYNAVGFTTDVATSIGGNIGGTIKDVYNGYITAKDNTKDSTYYAANAIRNYFKIATKSQQIIATASLILLIMYTLLNVVEGKFDNLIGMISGAPVGSLEITNGPAGGGKKTKSKAKTTKPPKTPTKPPTKTPTKPPTKTPTKPSTKATKKSPPKTPTKPPKTPKAVPKKKK